MHFVAETANVIRLVLPSIGGWLKSKFKFK